jgi:hypothetical protein
MTWRWAIFDYLDDTGVNVITEWLSELQKPERARMDRKIDALHLNGSNLSSDLLSDSSDKNIKKIRVNGRVALRLFLCRGPIDVQSEFTLLIGVIEKDRKVPTNTVPQAVERRKRVIADHKRRTLHEFAPATSNQS